MTGVFYYLHPRAGIVRYSQIRPFKSNSGGRRPVKTSSGLAAPQLEICFGLPRRFCGVMFFYVRLVDLEPSRCFSACSITGNANMWRSA